MGLLFRQKTARFGILLLCALLTGLVPDARSQTPAEPGDVRVEIDLLPSLTRAQTLSLATLGVDSRISGNRILNLIIENTTDQKLDELYLYINVSASGIGMITQLDQIQWRPFSLRPGQLITASNNDLQTGLPGIPERVRFSGELTAAGEDFVNRLEGSTTLPDRVYTVDLHVFHGNNRKNGGRKIAETRVVLPVEEMFTDVGFDLDAPGNVLGAPLERIASTRPVFRWQGSSNQSYRVVIVEAVEGQSAQGLIQAALDTEPIMGTADPGDLLEFEMADGVVTGNYFSYPASRAQPLEEGSRYYWQVFANISTPTGTELQPSPIWAFGIRRTGASLSDRDEEMLDVISRFLPERYQELLLNGYTVESAEINGQTVSGAQLLPAMEQFIIDLENGTKEIVE